MNSYFYRFRIASLRTNLFMQRNCKTVVIVDHDEIRARRRLQQMHPKYVILEVTKTLFEDRRAVWQLPHSVAPEDI